MIEADQRRPRVRGAGQGVPEGTRGQNNHCGVGASCDSRGVLTRPFVGSTLERDRSESWRKQRSG